MSQPPDEFLLLCTRGLSGEATAEERRRLEEFLQDPDRWEYFSELSARWREDHEGHAPVFDPEPAFARLTARLAAAETPVGSARAGSRIVAFPRWRSAWLWTVAAAAAIALGFSLWSVQTKTAGVPPGPWVERTAAAGETPVVVLADGSRVTLNGRSTLEFPETFGPTRTVRLKGEAFFEVAHDASRPFVVEAGDLRTTVLGTKFDVNVLPENRGTRVALVEGRVAVERLQADAAVNPVILRPGEQYSIGRGAGLGRVEAFDAEEASGWLSGLLVFRDEPLSVVAARLERKFGVAFEFTTLDLPNKAINARFEKESLPEILEILSFAGGIRCETVTERGAIARVRLWPTQASSAGR